MLYHTVNTNKKNKPERAADQYILKCGIMQQTKRRFSRISLEMPARVIVDGGASFEVEELVNLSIGGCLILNELDFVDGSGCKVTIPLSEGDEALKIEVIGEVVRREKEFIAVKFTKISPESLFHLQNLIRYNAPDSDRIDDEIEEHPGLV